MLCCRKQHSRLVLTNTTNQRDGYLRRKAHIPAYCFFDPVHSVAQVCCSLLLVLFSFVLVKLQLRASKRQLWQAGVSDGLRWSPPSGPTALCFSLPLSKAEPSDLLSTNRLWKRWADATSMNRLQRTVTSMLLSRLYCLLSLNKLVKQAAMMERPTWQGAEGGLQPAVVRNWDPRFNCLWGTESRKQSHELTSRFPPPPSSF